MKTFNVTLLSFALVLLAACGGKDQPSAETKTKSTMTFDGQTISDYFKDFQFNPYCNDETSNGYHGRQDVSTDDLIFYNDSGDRFLLNTNILFLDGQFKLRLEFGENVTFDQNTTSYRKVGNDILIVGKTRANNNIGTISLLFGDQEIGILNYGGKYNDESTLLLSLDNMHDLLPLVLAGIYKHMANKQIQITAYKYVYSDIDEASMFCLGERDQIFQN